MDGINTLALYLILYTTKGANWLETIPVCRPIAAPANTSNAGSMLDQRRRRWANIKPAFAQRRVFAGTCAAELFLSIFHSLKAVIHLKPFANAISSFKWRKVYLFIKNRPSRKLNYLMNWECKTQYCYFQWHFIRFETWLELFINTV